MSLSTQDLVLAKRRFFHAVNLDTATRLLSMAFFSWIAQQGGKPDLQVVEFGPLSNTDVVIADAANKLYAIILHKLTTTASYTKGTDHATTCSTDGTQDFSLKLADTNTHAVFFPKGRANANGWTMQGNTTGTGATGSSTNGAYGVVLLGAAN